MNKWSTTTTNSERVTAAFSQTSAVYSRICWVKSWYTLWWWYITQHSLARGDECGGKKKGRDWMTTRRTLDWTVSCQRNWGVRPCFRFRESPFCPSAFYFILFFCSMTRPFVWFPFQVVIIAMSYVDALDRCCDSLTSFQSKTFSFFKEWKSKERERRERP